MLNEVTVVPLVTVVYEAKFPIGTVQVTPWAQSFLKSKGVSHLSYLVRHSLGDWGDITRAEQQQNELAVKAKQGFLYSSYVLDRSNDERLNILTRWDRLVTTVSLPVEH